MAKESTKIRVEDASDDTQPHIDESSPYGDNAENSFDDTEDSGYDPDSDSSGDTPNRYKQRLDASNSETFSRSTRLRARPHPRYQNRSKAHPYTIIRRHNHSSNVSDNSTSSNKSSGDISQVAQDLQALDIAYFLEKERLPNEYEVEKTEVINSFKLYYQLLERFQISLRRVKRDTEILGLSVCGEWKSTSPTTDADAAQRVEDIHGCDPIDVTQQLDLDICQLKRQLDLIDGLRVNIRKVTEDHKFLAGTKEREEFEQLRQRLLICIPPCTRQS